MNSFERKARAQDLARNNSAENIAHRLVAVEEQLEEARREVSLSQNNNFELVSAQHRFRHPQKTMPDWSPWQPAEINTRRPVWTIDRMGYEVEYRLLYSKTPAPADSKEP